MNSTITIIPKRPIKIKIDWSEKLSKYNHRRPFWWSVGLVARDSILSFFLIDKVILGRCSFTGFWNSPSANMRIFSALWTSIILTLLILGTLHLFNFNFCDLIEKKSLTVVLSFYGSVGTMWYFERSDLYKRWQYLANLYNQHLTADEDDLSLLRASLALDVFEMKMWAHKSYFSFFNSELKLAIEHFKNNNDSFFIGEYDVKRDSDSLESKNCVISFDRIFEYLESYQSSLIAKKLDN